MVSTKARLEFRIPISPTNAFFSLVRFYNFALRRQCSPCYRDARLLIVVGDYCDLDEVRRRNRWSEDFNIVWERVPDRVFDEFHWGGTANWRFKVAAPDADMIILSDADTVLIRDIDPLLAEGWEGAPAVWGHMAHFPPGPGVKSIAPHPSDPAYWPWLFEVFDISEPFPTYRYSMDASGQLPMAPAYFNLGFVALNPAALEIFAAGIEDVTRRVTAATGSWMRCQIAVTILAHKAGMRVVTLPATYNAANDLMHLEFNNVSPDDIRVLHYLRDDEINKGELQPSLIDGLLLRAVTNPANRLLQALAEEYAKTMRSNDPGRDF